MSMYKDTYENDLTAKHLTPNEEMWVEGAIKHHSYFEIELSEMNEIRGAYYMDASEASELEQFDVDNPNFSLNFNKRLKDEGVKRVKIPLKQFKKFWYKHLVISLNTQDSVEYVHRRKVSKLYRCRIIGWAMKDYQKENYGR